MFSYDFGYSWWLIYGHLVPLTLFGALAAAAMWWQWRWRRWIAG